MSEKRTGQAGRPKQTKAVDMPSIDQLEGELKRTQYSHRYHSTLRTTVFSLVIVAAIAVVIAVLLLPVLQIGGNSMENTLSDGNMVISRNDGKYRIGDVIAFYYNNVILIKRVIAVSGDWVDITEDGTVSVNGAVLDEPYVTEKDFGQCNITLPYQVPQGKCFVMGDNRAVSIDSRNTAVGCVSDDVVIGRLVARVWPLKTIGFIS